MNNDMQARIAAGWFISHRDIYGDAVLRGPDGELSIYRPDGRSTDYTVAELATARAEYRIDDSMFPVTTAGGATAWGYFRREPQYMTPPNPILAGRPAW